MRRKEIFIDEEALGNHIFKELTDLGYAPAEDEADDIAAIVFEYLVSLGMEVED